MLPVEAQTLLALPIVLALERVAGELPPRLSLSRDEAAELAQLIAADLHALVPQVAEARLALAGALFDPVELLRPGFPVWATLDELARRVPRSQLDNVVAFGCHEGRMPAQPLEPSPIFADGPMRLLPLSLLAPATLATELSEQLEIQLVGRGEAGPLTSDWLIRTLGIPLEHVRYLSRNDLLALTCVQYEHVNLAPLWTLLEGALLTPYREESTMSARGLALHYAHGTVLSQSPSQWLAAQGGDAGERCASTPRCSTRISCRCGCSRRPMGRATPAICWKPWLRSSPVTIRRPCLRMKLPGSVSSLSPWRNVARVAAHARWHTAIRCNNRRLAHCWRGSRISMGSPASCMR